MIYVSIHKCNFAVINIIYSSREYDKFLNFHLFSITKPTRSCIIQINVIFYSSKFRHSTRDMLYMRIKFNLYSACNVFWPLSWLPISFLHSFASNIITKRNEKTIMKFLEIHASTHYNKNLPSSIITWVIISNIWKNKRQRDTFIDRTTDKPFLILISS